MSAKSAITIIVSTSYTVQTHLQCTKECPTSLNEIFEKSQFFPAKIFK